MNLPGIFSYEVAEGMDYPVEEWNPPFSGDLDILIKKNGVWFHEGEPIVKGSLVRLFSSLLKCEGDEYFLVTPVEKWRIQVEDRPLQVISIDMDTQPPIAYISSGKQLSLDSEREIRLSDLDGVEVPEIDTGRGLWARMNRNSYYTYCQSLLED